MISEEELNELIEKSRNREIEDARERRKGYEAFCDKISRMDDEQLREFAMTLPKKLGKKNITKEEESRIYGEINRVVDEIRTRQTGHSNFSKNKKLKWFEDCGFVISYGVKGELIPLGDIVTYQQLQLYNNSSEIEEYEELSDDDKRKTLEAVFLNKKGDLRLRVPVGSLMELKDVLEKDSYSNIEKVGREMVKLLSAKNESENTIVATGVSWEEIGGTIESIDLTAETVKEILGTNYSVYPFNLGRYKKLEERYRFVEGIKIKPDEVSKSSVTSLRREEKEEEMER